MIVGNLGMVTFFFRRSDEYHLPAPHFRGGQSREAFSLRCVPRKCPGGPEPRGSCPPFYIKGGKIGYSPIILEMFCEYSLMYSTSSGASRILISAASPITNLATPSILLTLVLRIHLPVDVR